MNAIARSVSIFRQYGGEPLKSPRVRSITAAARARIPLALYLIMVFLAAIQLLFISFTDGFRQRRLLIVKLCALRSCYPHYVCGYSIKGDNHLAVFAGPDFVALSPEKCVLLCRQFHDKYPPKYLQAASGKPHLNSRLLTDFRLYAPE
jgi:hypothetical protein